MDFKQKELERLLKEFREAKKSGENLVLININGGKKVIRPNKLTEGDFINQYENSGYFTNEGVKEIRGMIDKKDYEGLLNIKGITVEPDGSLSTNVGGQKSTIQPPKDKLVIRQKDGQLSLITTSEAARTPDLLTGSTVISDPIGVVPNTTPQTSVSDVGSTPQTPVETVGTALLQQPTPLMQGLTNELPIPYRLSDEQVVPQSGQSGIPFKNNQSPYDTPVPVIGAENLIVSNSSTKRLFERSDRPLPPYEVPMYGNELLSKHPKKGFSLPPVPNSRLDVTSKFNNLFNVGQTALENLVPKNNTVPKQSQEKEQDKDYTKWTEGDKLALAAVGLPSLINIGRGLFEKAETYQPIYNTQAGSALNEMVTRRLDIDRTDGRTKAIAARKVIQDNSTSSASRNANLMNLYGTSREFEDKISNDEAMYNDITMPAQNAQFRLGVGDTERAAREQARQYNIQARQAKDNILTTGLGQLAATGVQAGNNLNTKASNEIAKNAMQTSNYKLGQDYNTQFKDGSGILDLAAFFKEISDRNKPKKKEKEEDTEIEVPSTTTGSNKYGGLLGRTDLLPNFDLERKNKEALLMLKSLTNKIRTTKKYK